MNNAHEICHCPDRCDARRRQDAVVCSRSHTSRRPVLRVVLVCCAVVGLGCLPTTAAAHKVTVFAAVSDRQIVGQVAMQNGSAAPNTRITVMDPAGRELAKLVTDREGRFRFTPRAKCDHKLVANAGLGHTAEFLVPAAELPADLPAVDAAGAAVSGRELSEQGVGSPGVGDRPEASDDVRAIGQQLIALRIDLERWRNQLRLQDMLGGIGYILGISGLVFYLLGLRRKSGASSQPASMTPASPREAEDVATDVPKAR